MFIVSFETTVWRKYLSLELLNTQYLHFYSSACGSLCMPVMCCWTGTAKHREIMETDSKWYKWARKNKQRNEDTRTVISSHIETYWDLTYVPFSCLRVEATLVNTGTRWVNIYLLRFTFNLFFSIRLNNSQKSSFAHTNKHIHQHPTADKASHQTHKNTITRAFMLF